MDEPFLPPPSNSNPPEGVRERSASFVSGLIRAPSVSELIQDESTTRMWNWYLSTQDPTPDEIAGELAALEPGKKHRARFEHWISLWNGAKTRTDTRFEPELVALQMAAAEEFGLSMPYLRQEQKFASVQKALKDYEGGMRAFTRAMYAYTQKHLQEQGIEGAVLWRGIKRSERYPFTYSEGFLLGQLANNPIASWTLSLGQASRFALSDVGALNCAYIEASRFLGTPFTGLGVLPQSEALSLGTVLTQEGDQCFWLVWRNEDSGQVARSLTLEDWRDLIEKYETDIMDDKS